MARPRVLLLSVGLGLLAVTCSAGTGLSATDVAIAGGGTPAISSFTPTSGPVGSIVTVYGTNFSGATSVKFNGTAATQWVVNSSTKISARVPAGAITGPISVTTPGGAGTSATAFTVTGGGGGSAPTVTSFSPMSGVVTTIVTVVGTGFTDATSVKFNGTAATQWVVNSSTKISARVPAGAITGPISVTTPGGAGTSATAFTVLPAGIFVALGGSDTSGDGSISKPFATLAKAQAAMRVGGPQFAYIRGGYYTLPAVTQNGISYGLYLTAADNGQTWSYYPPDGYNSAILDGGSTSSSTGIKELITIDGSSHVTINGLQLQHFRWVGIGLHGGKSFKELFPASTAMADSNTVTNNVIHDGSYDTSPISGYGGGAFYNQGNIPNTTVTNNVIYNISTSGIQVEAGYAGYGGNLSSLSIANNVVLSTCLLVRDCGSIYVQDTNTTSTNIRITNNFVRDSGTPTSKARSIYLDDGVSGAVVSNNISTGVFNFAFTIHGGRNNTISSNIADMGPSNNREILLYQGDGLTGMTGNTVGSNIIVSGGGGGWYEGKSFGAQPVIKNNVYHQYAGAPVYTRGLNGLNGDASPVSADPQLSCWTYVLASGSPVYSSPASFVPLARNWGPPGYIVPKTGTPPSQSHSC